MAGTTDHVTFAFTSEMACRRCGMAVRPDVVIEVEALVQPFIASVELALQTFKEELMTASSDLHDLVSKLNDALVAINTELANATAAQVADQANAVSTTDLSALRDAVDRATALGNQAIATSTAVQTEQGQPVDTSTTPTTPAVPPNAPDASAPATTDTSATPSDSGTPTDAGTPTA